MGLSQLEVEAWGPADLTRPSRPSLGAGVGPMRIGPGHHLLENPPPLTGALGTANSRCFFVVFFFARKRPVSDGKMLG